MVPVNLVGSISNTTRRTISIPFNSSPCTAPVKHKVFPGVEPFTTIIGVASLNPPTAASEFQVKRTAVPGFISVSKINFESDKGVVGATEESKPELDASLLTDETIDELTANESLLADDILTALADKRSLTAEEELVAAAEDAVDVSAVIAASELSATASKATFSEETDAAAEETSDAKAGKLLTDDVCALSLAVETLLVRLLTTDSFAEAISVCAEAKLTKKTEQTKSKKVGILLRDR